MTEFEMEDVGLAGTGWAACSQDASTLSKNPAGMSFLEGNQLARVLLMPLVVGFEVLALESEAELAKKTQSPVADLISIPFQNNTNFGIGLNNRTQNVRNV